MRGGGAFLGALVLSLATAGTASATMVSTYSGVDDEDTGYESGVTVRDSAGERNFLTVTVNSGRVTVREAGRAPLRAGRGCRRRARGLVVCRERGLGGAGVWGGRGSDRVVVRCVGGGASAYGGGGADRIRLALGCGGELAGGGGDDVLTTDGAFRVYGGSGNDLLRAGAGDDRLYGGLGRDTVNAGAGRDVVHADEGDGRGGDDVIDGGEGDDSVVWNGRRSVRVDLARGIGGINGERDRLASIENAAGDRGDDILVGDGGPNRLRGGGGSDRMIGRGGDDLLDSGNPSPPELSFPNNDRDSFACGRGRDIVVDPANSVLPAPCEAMRDDYWLDRLVVPARPRRAGAARVLVPTVCSVESPSCKRQALLKSGATELGRSAVKTDFRREISWLSVDLRKPLPRDGIVRVEIIGEDEDSDVGNTDPIPYEFTWRFSCRGAPPGDACLAPGRSD